METHTRDSLLAVHGIDVQPRPPFRFRAWFAALMTRIAETGRRRRDFRLLMSKSERELADIGLTRDDVVAGFHYGCWPERKIYRR